jgi:poly(3-hydroxybutyrate) depolymerase
MPYISDCSFDAAGSILQHILPGAPLKPRDLNWQKWGQLYQFDQEEFAGSKFENSGLGKEGFLYIPYNCALTDNCRVHVAFHGCSQSKMFLGDTYVKNTGYLEWAGPNNLILLFPQATAVSQVNDHGCWDFFGFTLNYLTRHGVQASAIRQMVERLQQSN